MTRTLFAMLLVGCGARTELGVERSEDASADVTRADARVDADGGTDALVFPDAPLEETCLADSDCPGRACVRDTREPVVDRAPVPLACGSAEAARTDGATCDRETDCGRGLCVVAGTCVEPCRDAGDCRGGEVCVSLEARTAVARTQPLRGCVREFDSAFIDTVEELELTWTSGTALPIARRSAEETLLVVARGGLLPFEARRLAQRDGEVLFDLERLELPWGNPFAAFGDPLIVELPNSAASPAADGYQVIFEPDPFGPSTRRLRVVTQRGVGERSVLDLDVFYVGTRFEPTADGEPPPYVRETLAQAQEILAAAGVMLGEVRHHRVPGELGRSLSVLDADPATGEVPRLAELYALSAGAGRASLAVFFVREVEGALGISGGIPGPWGIHGTAQSGIALSADFLREAEDFGVQPGAVLSHESGHFLGLYHTTEADGSHIEPITDTPRCADEDGDGFVSPMECPSGATNLMFWSGLGDTLSAEQGQILRRALLLR